MLMNNEEMKVLCEVEGTLSHAMDGDYCCGAEDCTDKHPQCREREMLVATKKLIALLEPKHKSLHQARLKNDFNVAEKVYAEHWIEENKRNSAINRGFTLLEWILTPTGQECPSGRVSHRDAEVAASVIQWLGTNCGLAFLGECERKIKELQGRQTGLTDR
jgi:hypothetical protein